MFPSAENEEIFERVRDTGEPIFFHAKPFVYADQPERGVTYWDWSLVPVVDEGSPTDLKELIERVLTLTRKRLKDEGIEVVRRTADGLPQPKVVPDRIQQVLLNLVLNAVEAMSEGGTLELATWYDSDRSEVCLAVSDSGMGMPSEVLENLFDPFFSTKDDGMGLGLFVSQNIVQEYGGLVEVESEIGEGTTFTVRLPVQRTAVESEE